MQKSIADEHIAFKQLKTFPDKFRKKRNKMKNKGKTGKIFS